MFSVVSQRTEIKKQKSRLEALQKEEEAERERARARARERVIRNFERSQASLIRDEESHKNGNPSKSAEQRPIKEGLDKSFHLRFRIDSENKNTGV